MLNVLVSIPTDLMRELWTFEKWIFVGKLALYSKMDRNFSSSEEGVNQCDKIWRNFINSWAISDGF